MNTTDSVVYQRMNQRGGLQMPLTGTNEIDDTGLTTIGLWINSLPTE
jgi:hypothetical protein